jgi:hypothetical protein
LSYFIYERALAMIALISLANDHPLLKKDQSDAFIKSYCDFGFGGRVGLLDFCDQLGRACIARLLRAGSFGIAPHELHLSARLTDNPFLAGLDARTESAQS